MKKKFLLLFTILAVSAALLTDRVESRRQAAAAEEEFDQDEFSEFDSLDEDGSSSVKKSENNKKQQKSSANIEVTPAPPGFFSDDSFDDSIENEDETTDMKQQQPKPVQQQEASSKKEATKESKNQQFKSARSSSMADLDTEEFEHFVDDEEFEGFESKSSSMKQQSMGSESSKKLRPEQVAKSSGGVPDLKITDVPTHLMSTSSWHNYIWEIVMLVVIALYFANFMYGKSKNYGLVSAWYAANREMLEKNFALVGDNGGSVEVNPVGASGDDEAAAIPPPSSLDLSRKLIKDSENCYGLWCSGRAYCEGCLVQLKLVKRQDLVNGTIMQLIKPQSDQLVLSVEFAAQDDVDSFVFCLANKKITQQLFADYQDLATYCTERKTVPSGGNVAGLGLDYKYADLLAPSVAAKYVLLNEVGEVPSMILDANVCKFLTRFPDVLEYLLISDQFVGYKVQSGDEAAAAADSSSGNNTATPTAAELLDSSLGIPKSRAIMILVFNVPGKGWNTAVGDMQSESMQRALQLAIYLIDRVGRVRLSREAKVKAVKKRKDVAEIFMKSTNKQRQEAAQQRKEERRRAEKDRIMNESDPEKQRRLEEKEQKREKKKSLSKFKQVKIKSM